MKLNLQSLKDKKIWEEKGYNLPEFNIETVTEATKKAPTWLHFGAGNIFRIFPAALQQTLLNKGISNKGIIVCETYDEEIIEKVFKPYDNLTVAVTLKHTGEMVKTVVASIVEAITLLNDFPRLKEIFVAPSLEMVSFTITEKGYLITGQNGEVLPIIQTDMDNKPEEAKTVMGVLTAMCYLRYKAGKYPITLLSMDNCSHNGDKVSQAITAFAKAWVEKGYVEKGFYDYITDKKTVSCPLSMIDKITPRPADVVKETLTKDGLTGMETVTTTKNTYASAFVNAEETQYLVVEDIFPNGRQALENAGVIFTDRETVDKVEKMKVCTCLNPLHTILATFGCMLGYNSISDEMKDENLKTFIERASYIEGMPVVVDPKIIDPKEFLSEVINKRFPNPFVPDTPQRIACDNSQKIPVRFGETLKAYITKGQEVKDLTYIPLFIAGWLRYLLGVADDGREFTISPDPMLPELQKQLNGLKLSNTENIHEIVKPILSNAKLFGIDLYAYGLGEKVEAYFKELNAGVGAVRKTLQKYTS